MPAQSTAENQDETGKKPEDEKPAESTDENHDETGKKPEAERFEKPEDGKPANMAAENHDEAGEKPGEELMERFRGWIEENLKDEAIRSKAEEEMAKIAESLAAGTIPEVLFELVTKGADYDRAVSEATAAGELKGRNAKIAEERALQMEGDGVPHPGAGGDVYDMPAPSIFEVARGAW